MEILPKIHKRTSGRCNSYSIPLLLSPPGRTVAVFIDTWAFISHPRGYRALESGLGLDHHWMAVCESIHHWSKSTAVRGGVEVRPRVPAIGFLSTIRPRMDAVHGGLYSNCIYYMPQRSREAHWTRLSVSIDDSRSPDPLDLATKFFESDPVIIVISSDSQAARNFHTR